MSPHHSAELLWILGALCHPRVGYLLTGDIQQLETKLAESLAWKGARSGGPPGDGVADGDKRLAREILEKILPMKLRLPIPELNPDERFDRNLGELLSRIPSDHEREVLSAFLRRDLHTAPAVPGRIRKNQALLSILRRMAAGSERPPAYELVRRLWHAALSESILPEKLRERIGATVEFIAAEPSLHPPPDPVPPEASRLGEPLSSRTTAGEGAVSRDPEDRDGGKTALPTRPQLWIDTTSYLYYPRPATRFTWALSEPLREIPGFGGWRLDIAAVERPALYFFDDAFGDMAIRLDPALEAALCLAADVAASFSWGSFANEPLGVSGFQNPFIRISFLWKKSYTQFSLTWPLPLWDSFRDGYRFGRLFLRHVESREGDVLSAEDLVLPYLALAGHVSLFSAGPGYTDPEEESANDNLVLDALRQVSGPPPPGERASTGLAAERFRSSCRVVWEVLDRSRHLRRERDASLGEFDRQFVNARREMTRAWVRAALSLLEQPESGLAREFRGMLGMLWGEPFVTTFKIERMSASALQTARIQRILAGSYHSGERTEFPFRQYESFDSPDKTPEEIAVTLVTELDGNEAGANPKRVGRRARK
ncbi:MAG: hypothetical protein L6R30_10020 [Thermoanaerobaculia bacterium]|nr:hypothetical protein [Thermoanaerobaculia bacterium]